MKPYLKVGDIPCVLEHHCANCNKSSSKLRICLGCNVVRYCSREHQVEHREQHKKVCNKIKRCRAKLQAEEHAVRNATPDFMTPANAFETHEGRFWGIVNTREYMRARHDLLDAVRHLGTLDGIKEALEHAQDMLRLCRGDNMGIRSFVPPLLLQLDQDQECYDFVKWYETEGQRSDYDWGNMDLPFLNVKNANVFEDVEYLDHEFGSISNLTAIILLKLKLLIDVINLRLCRQVLALHLPIDMWREVELAIIESPLSTELVRKTTQELMTLTKALQDQIIHLSAIAADTNQYFFPGLLNPDENLRTRPDLYSPGSVEEMRLTLQYSYPAWLQTLGALELLKSAKAIADKNSIVEEMMTDDTHLSVWTGFNWAAEDASSLRAERPSDEHRKELKDLFDTIRARRAVEEEEDEADLSETSSNSD